MAFKRSSVRSRPAPPNITKDTVKLGCSYLAVSLFQEDDCVRFVTVLPANPVGISYQLGYLSH